MAKAAENAKKAAGRITETNEELMKELLERAEADQEKEGEEELPEEPS